MNPVFTAIALALAIGLLPMAAQAPATPMKPAHAWARIAEQLQLTENQKTHIQLIQARHATATKTLKQETAEARKAFQEALRRVETPVAQLRPLYQSMQDKVFDLMMDRRTLDGEIRALLTPEQRTEWDKMLADRQSKKHGPQKKGR
jgi:Spy/CpxP family protein refolding chaperone